MEDRAFLSHFITEDIYLISDTVSAENQGADQIETAPDYLVVTAEPIDDTNQDFLFKVFSSVKVTPDQLQLQTINDPLNTGYQMVFFFGCVPENMMPDLYGINDEQDQPMVLVDSLKEISNDTHKKRQLWSLLQQLFH